MVSDLVVFCPVLTVVLSLSSCSNQVVVLSSKSESMSLPPLRSMSSVSIGIKVFRVIPSLVLVCSCCSLWS